MLRLVGNIVGWLVGFISRSQIDMYNNLRMNGHSSQEFLLYGNPYALFLGSKDTLGIAQVA